MENAFIDISINLSDRLILRLYYSQKDSEKNIHLQSNI